MKSMEAIVDEIVASRKIAICRIGELQEKFESVFDMLSPEFYIDDGFAGSCYRDRRVLHTEDVISDNVCGVDTLIVVCDLRERLLAEDEVPEWKKLEESGLDRGNVLIFANELFSYVDFNWIDRVNRKSLEPGVGDDLIYDVLYRPKWEHNSGETMELGGIIIPLIKMNHYTTYIYACEGDVSSLILYLHENGIEVKGIIDRNLSKTIIRRWDGIPIIHISQMDRIPNIENVFVIIGVHSFWGVCASDIMDILYGAGIRHYYAVPAKDRDLISTHDGPTIDYYRDHYPELKRAYETLGDELSREAMLEAIRTKMQCCFYSKPACLGRHKYFFGHRIGDSYEQLYTHKKDEVWLNCGASVGDTIFTYFANGLDAKMVYAVEGDKGIFKDLCRNLDRLPGQYREKVTARNIFIDNGTDFGDLLPQIISLINADIEGHEMALIKALSRRIVQDRPVLAICVYHKVEDFSDFLSYLTGILENYTYLIRKYPTFSMWKRWSKDELVFYAIPNERRAL